MDRGQLLLTLGAGQTSPGGLFRPRLLPGTVATLYFDLLGFGTQASSVSIDDVRLIRAIAEPPLEFQLDPAADSGALRDALTNESLVSLVGATDPALQVLLDTDSDGFDDGNATADGIGNFRFDNVPVAEGANVIRTQVTADGETTVVQRTIRRDTQAPSGAQVLPTHLAVLNADAGLIEVQWTDAGVGGLDADSIDPTDVTVTGVSIDSIIDLGNGLVRYIYSGDGDALPKGTIQVRLVAGAAADLVGNTSELADFSFTIDRLSPAGMLVDPAPASTVSSDLGHVTIQWLDLGLAGLDTTTFGIGDVTVTGVSVDRVEDLGGGLVRYWYDDDQTLSPGTIEVALQAGAVSDLAGNASTAATASFTVASADEPVDVTDLVTVQYYGVQYNRRTGVWAFYGQVTNNSDQPLLYPIRGLVGQLGADRHSGDECRRHAARRHAVLRDRRR